MIVFITGGAKNGKSSYAQELAVRLAAGGKHYYIATMIPVDEEDRERIRRHIADREGMGFETVEQVTGRGGGITDEAFQKKKEVISRAIAINQPDRTNVVDVLAKVGGLDIAAMCGAFLGAAATKRPVVIDGFISAVAALCAVRLKPEVRDYLVPSHASFEIGYKLAMDAMGLQPMLLLGMRLGEGSGCPLAFQVLDAACAIMNEMATFQQAGIDDGYLEEIRQGDKFTVEDAT